MRWWSCSAGETRRERGEVENDEHATDEDAFRAIREIGITVYVGSEESDISQAEYYLKSPQEVEEFLTRCLEILKMKKFNPEGRQN